MTTTITLWPSAFLITMSLVCVLRLGHLFLAAAGNDDVLLNRVRTRFARAFAFWFGVLFQYLWSRGLS